MLGYYVLIGAIALVSWMVSSTLKRKFAKYSKIHLRNGMSGREIAEKMLADNGIYDVEVISTPGQLTDHYNPKNKTVNLSEAVYNQRNAAAAAVAAHEVGHAVHKQHEDVVNNWLYSRFGWQIFSANKKGIDDWLNLMGGYRNIPEKQNDPNLT